MRNFLASAACSSTSMPVLPSSLYLRSKYALSENIFSTVAAGLSKVCLSLNSMSAAALSRGPLLHRRRREVVRPEPHRQVVRLVLVGHRRDEVAAPREVVDDFGNGRA